MYIHISIYIYKYKIYMFTFMDRLQTVASLWSRRPKTGFSPNTPGESRSFALSMSVTCFESHVLKATLETTLEQMAPPKSGHP